MSLVVGYISIRIITVFPHIAISSIEDRNIAGALMSSKQNFWGLLLRCFRLMVIFNVLFFVVEKAIGGLLPVLLETVLYSLGYVLSFGVFITFASLAYGRLSGIERKN